jgi:transposase
MVNRRISGDIKEVGLDLWEKGWDILDICEALYISRSSLYRWRTIFDEFGAVTRPPSPLRGRTRIISRVVLEAIRIIYKSTPEIYLDELQFWLAIHHDIAISVSALQQNLEDAGLTRKILHKIAVERDEVLRAKWRENITQNFSGTGNEFVFADEISKNDHSTARRYGRALAGERADFHDVFVRGDRYSLVAAMSKKGYIAAEVVPGSFDSFDFFDFIAEQVVSPFDCHAKVHSYLLYVATTDESVSRQSKCPRD